MSETNTIEHNEHGDSGSLTPLDAILGSGSEPVVTASGEPPSQGETNDAGEMVPLVALKRERERRQKMDRQVQELEAELQRYNDQKWGFEEEPNQQQSAPNAEAGPDQDRVVAEYNNSYARFIQKHGEDRVAEIDAALRRLNPEQQAHVTSLVGQGDGDLGGACAGLH